MRSFRGIAALMLMLCLPYLAMAAKRSDKTADEPDPSPMSAETFTGLELRGIGPALMSGRVADLVIHPQRPSTWYVAVGSGNVWKTTNAGTTWTPIFDGEGSYSIGCITLDPSNPEILWVGTGENVGGRHVGYGDGVYKSLDGGASWERMGLESSEHIGNIVVDPRSSDVVFVAVQGPLWSAGGDRGLYKTTDGGSTWEKVLGGGEYTGVTEVHMDPRNPDVLYAATHQRFRNVAALINGGPETGIHKSVDGGATWRELTKGLPEEDMGKIGIAISPQKPDVIYATIELAHRKGGLYRSENGGESWTMGAEYVSGATGPHYYQEIFASPHKFDRIYQMDNRLHVSEDGGKTFAKVPEKSKHVDNHALAFRADLPDYLLAGCDGGVYESWDLGQTWKFVANLPVTQFYKLAVDYDEPFYNVYGGTQDNNTQGGPSRTDNVNGIRNSDWFITLWGDGHQPAVDPTNPNIIYSEWQGGNLVRHDRKTGEGVYIQPQPDRGEDWDRFNWDSPILISPHDPKTLFYASQRVWRSDDRGDAWRPISDDLTRDLDRYTLPMMGRVWSYDAVWDLLAMSKYSTITSLSQSPLNAELIYAGTDDGLIQVTEDGGKSWRKIDELPGDAGRMFFVNDVKADLHDEDAVYVVVDHHKDGDFAPYVFRSTDRGKSWSSIVGDLPERHVVWRLVQDHVNPQLLFVGTEFGVFFTVDAGGRWVKLVGGVPNIPFRDLAIQTRENDLVGATFGRGFYILDDYTPLRQVTEQSLEQEVELFPVRKAWWYVERRPLGGTKKASQGDAFFVAPNPPFGAVFTYYLRDEIQTNKQSRNEQEKKVAEEGGDTPYPGWDELRKEELEEDPAIVLTVRDAEGNTVRRLSGPVKAGFHRVAWDLRYPPYVAWAPKKEEVDDDEEDRNRGYLAAPGTYTVSLAKRVDGALTDLGKMQTFEVVPLHDGGTLPGDSPQQVAAFMEQLAALQRQIAGATAAIAHTDQRLKTIQEMLMRSTVGDASLDDEARSLARELAALKDQLEGNRNRGRKGDPGPVSITRRAGVVHYGNALSTHGPTATHRKSMAIAEEEFVEVRQRLDRLIRTDLPALEKKLDAAGVPWTPGRSVPD